MCFKTTSHNGSPKLRRSARYPRIPQRSKAYGARMTDVAILPVRLKLRPELLPEAPNREDRKHRRDVHGGTRASVASCRKCNSSDALPCSLRALAICYYTEFCSSLQGTCLDPSQQELHPDARHLRGKGSSHVMLVVAGISSLCCSHSRSKCHVSPCLQLNIATQHCRR